MRREAPAHRGQAAPEEPATATAMPRPETRQRARCTQRHSRRGSRAAPTRRATPGGQGRLGVGQATHPQRRRPEAPNLEEFVAASALPRRPSDRAAAPDGDRSGRAADRRAPDPYGGRSGLSAGQPRRRGRRSLGAPQSLVAKVLAKLQGFDPPGVLARDLAECLALQLKDAQPLRPADRQAARQPVPARQPQPGGAAPRRRRRRRRSWSR